MDILPFPPPDDEPPPEWVLYHHNGRPGARWEVLFRGPEDDAKVRWLYESEYRRNGRLALYNHKGHRVCSQQLPPAP
jgi:hypothetical protein